MSPVFCRMVHTLGEDWSRAEWRRAGTAPDREAALTSWAEAIESDTA